MNQLTFSASSYKPRKTYCSYRQSLELERLYVGGKEKLYRSGGNGEKKRVTCGIHGPEESVKIKYAVIANGPYKDTRGLQDLQYDSLHPVQPSHDHQTVLSHTYSLTGLVLQTTQSSQAKPQTIQYSVMEQHVPIPTNHLQKVDQHTMSACIYNPTKVYLQDRLTLHRICVGIDRGKLLYYLLLTSMPHELLTNSPHLKFDDVAMSLYNVIYIQDRLRRKQSCIDQPFTLRQLMEKAIEKRRASLWHSLTWRKHLTD